MEGRITWHGGGGSCCGQLSATAQRDEAVVGGIVADRKPVGQDELIVGLEAVVVRNRATLDEGTRGCKYLGTCSQSLMLAKTQQQVASTGGKY